MTNSVSKTAAIAAVAVVVLLFAAVAWYFLHEERGESNPQAAGIPYAPSSTQAAGSPQGGMMPGRQAVPVGAPPVGGKV